MPRYDVSKPLLGIIVLLVLYIFHIHLSEPRIPLPQQTGLDKYDAKTNAQAPVRPSSPRIAIITMNTVESSYDILSLANKQCMRLCPNSLGSSSHKLNYLPGQRTRTDTVMTSKSTLKVRGSGIS